MFKKKISIKNYYLKKKPFIYNPFIYNPLQGSTCNAEDIGDEGLIPRSGRFPWRRKWQPSPVFLLEKSHGQWSLAGYSPKGRRVRHD